MKKNKFHKRFYDRATLCHVLKRFKDGKETLIVYKYWQVKHQIWIYKTITLKLYDYNTQIGLYSLKKNEKYRNQKLF